MKWFSIASLRCRLIVLVLMAVIPLAGLMFFTASAQKQRSVAAIEDHVLTMAELAASEEEQMLEGSRQLLVSLAYAFKEHWFTPSECSPYLLGLLSHFQRYENFGAVAIDGTLCCSAVPFKPGFDPRQQPWFRRVVATREFAISDYQPGVHADDPVVMLSYPAADTDGRLLGVVFTALDIQWLNRFKFGIEDSLPRDSTIAQVDAQGVILAHHPDFGTQVGQMLAQTALVQRMQSVQKGMVTLPGPDGQPWFYAFSQLHSTLRSQRVHLLLGVPQRTVFRDANRMLINNLALLAAVASLILLAAWFGIDLFVLRQVKTMLAATRKLTAGDLSARTGIARGTGELNELAHAFDDMAAALETRDAQRHKAEQELRNSHEQLRNLSSHLQSVREEERTRLAREIHDELGQALTALKMDTAWLNRRLVPDQKPLLEKARSMGDLIDATIRTVQRLSGELRPGLLDDLGLAAAIEWQAEEFQKRTGLPCAVRVELQNAALSREHTTAIFRIFQETLTNVLRHARATRVSVRLQTRGNQLTLEVDDNGRGITEEEIRRTNAFGLIGMHERVLAMKGQMAINGRLGRGTTVTVTVPLVKGEDSP